MPSDASAARMNRISHLRLMEHVGALRATNGVLPHIDESAAVIEDMGAGLVRVVAFDAANGSQPYPSCSLNTMAFHPDALEQTMALVLDRLASAACAPFN